MTSQGKPQPVSAIKGMRIIGKVCTKHPEMVGERHESDKRCVNCRRESLTRYRHTNKGKASFNETKRRMYAAAVAENQLPARKRQSRTARRIKVSGTNKIQWRTPSNRRNQNGQSQ